MASPSLPAFWRNAQALHTFNRYAERTGTVLPELKAAVTAIASASSAWAEEFGTTALSAELAPADTNARAGTDASPRSAEDSSCPTDRSPATTSGGAAGGRLAGGHVYAHEKRQYVTKVPADGVPVPSGGQKKPCCCCVTGIDVSNLRQATPEDLSKWSEDVGAGALGHCFDITLTLARYPCSGGPCTLAWYEYGVVRPDPGRWAPSSAFPHSRMVGQLAHMYDPSNAVFSRWAEAFTTTDCPTGPIKLTDCKAATYGLGGAGGSARYKRWLYIVMVAKSGCPGCPPKVAFFKQYLHVTCSTYDRDTEVRTVEGERRAQGGENWFPHDIPERQTVMERVRT